MKWFGNKTISPFPGERAEQFVEYLQRSGDLPEKDSIMGALYDTVREYIDEIDLSTTKKIINLKNTVINHWLAMFGSKEVIDYFIEKEPEQTIIANILQNDNLGSLERLEKLTDKTNRGMMNQRIINDRN